MKNEIISKTMNRNFFISKNSRFHNLLKINPYGQMWAEKNILLNLFIFLKLKRFHHVRDSLLSSASGYTNYRGILNLCVILLVMSSGRLVLENIIKYGFLVRFDIPILFVKDPTAWPSLLAIVCSSNFFKNYLFFLSLLL